MSTLPSLRILDPVAPGDDAKAIIKSEASNEFVFAVVGHAGSGTSMIAKTLEARIAEETMLGHRFQVAILKARDVIKEWATKNGRAIPQNPKSLKDVELMQDLGDDMRAEARANGISDYSAVARGLVKLIQNKRQEQAERGGGCPTNESGNRPKAYVLDSIRHPAEVELLRFIYGDAFVLIGVVCEENKRVIRIQNKYNCNKTDALSFMERDADDKKKYGQHVADAFHLADFFVDNTIDRFKPNREENRDWKASEDLSRLIKIITRTDLIRPNLAETAMYHASSAQLQSACLSRQVGASLVDAFGNVIATGTNEVPAAGGGVYGERNEIGGEDGRCAFRLDTKTGQHLCRNTNRQNEIIDELLDKIPELKAVGPERRATLREEVRKTRIGSLLEFSRAVHAEMDALLSAGRKGVSTKGCSLYVTTFPCHYCARHIVSAGVDEVQYIEPYPKSLAIDLHDDSIVVEANAWTPPNKNGSHVLFRPFSGVSPRLYKRAFVKDRELKDKQSGIMKIHAPEWVSPWHLPVSSYLDRERKITNDDGNE